MIDFPNIRVARCMTCQPWCRLWRNPATGVSCRQVLHEDHCPTHPRFSRDDLTALTGD